jgi:hypothetical protein
MSLLNLNQIPVSELPKASPLARFITVGGIVLGVAGPFLYIGGWSRAMAFKKTWKIGRCCVPL